MYNKIDILAKYIESLLLQSDGGGAIRKTLATVPPKGNSTMKGRINMKKRLLAMMMAIVMSNDAAADKRIGGRR